MVSLRTLLDLLGQSIHSPETRTFFSSLGLHEESDPEDAELGLDCLLWLPRPTDGYLLRASPAGRIDVVFLYLAATEEYSPFRGELIGGLTSSAGRAAVREAFGLPADSAEVRTDSVLGVLGATDCYDHGPVRICFVYSPKGEGLERITAELREAGA
jgi:hypothetical protein